MHVLFDDCSMVYLTPIIPIIQTEKTKFKYPTITCRLQIMSREAFLSCHATIAKVKNITLTKILGFLQCIFSLWLILADIVDITLRISKAYGKIP